MQELKYKMIRYMAAEELAENTINLYSRVFDKLLFDVKYIENRGNFFWIEYLSNIPDSINRNNYRSVILKVCRDVLGENISLPIINRQVRMQPIYSIEDVNKIYERIKNLKHKAIFSMLFVESMRVDEVLSIKISDCCKQDGSVILRNTKNNKDYKKYLDKSTIASLREYLLWSKKYDKCPKHLLFEGKWNEKYSSTSVRKFIEKAMLLAGVEKKGACHIFRRSASVWKIENGWGVTHLAASLNNSPKTAQKYYALIRPEYLQTLPKPQLHARN